MPMAYYFCSSRLAWALASNEITYRAKGTEERKHGDRKAGILTGRLSGRLNGKRHGGIQDADPEARNEVQEHPFHGTGVYTQKTDESCAEGSEEPADIDTANVVARTRDDDAHYYTRRPHAKGFREECNASLDWSELFNGLVVEG
jgi:hypothetical protein